MEEKLHQLIISRLNGYEVNSNNYIRKILELVRRGIGGFIIFGGRKNEIKSLIQEIQSFSEVSLFIASDVECGVGKQIENATYFPCQMAIASAINRNAPADVNFFNDILRAISEELIDIGINMPLIPVLDINQNPDNPIICTRAFSDEPEDVTWFGLSYIKELESAGLISCAKHFPGHGDTDKDSHISLPVINKTFKEMKEIDMVPFIEAIKEGVSSIMVGHLNIPSVDSKPASLSRNVITELLRKKLGFEGLVLTDALNMKALKDIKDISIECIKAGADILLHPEDVDKTFNELKSAVERRILTEEEIDRTVNRIMKLKERIKNIRAWDLKKGEVDYQSHKELSVKLTQMSITAIKNTGILPVTDIGRINVVLAGEKTLFEASPLRAYLKNVFTINEAKKLGNSIILFAIFTDISAGKRTSGISDREKEKIYSLMKKARNSIVISFGSPYVLRFFKDADVLIAAYESTEQAQMAVIKCLKGEADFKGRLPVKI
ncbi:MAG: glycoside hydrolase family 3 protein [Thermodesulfovibrionales bacterium]